MTDDIYRELILEHWRTPSKSAPLKTPTYENILNNASCGDAVQVQLLVNNGIINDVSFQVSGCALATASASVLAEDLIGKTVLQANKYTEASIRLLLGGIDPIVAREKCLTLGLQAMQRVLS